MNVLDRDMLSSVMKPIETANGLPNAFYTDADVFEAEKRVLFGSSWACMGFAKDVPNKGATRTRSRFWASPCLLCVAMMVRSRCSRMCAVTVA